ncbi:neuronal pentraxin-1-like isoform X2 [Dunckerocampus dactyliophorus]|uniref:neuronal pentraxin-1-like isoform X2 n=1 Tax=Dunckerocampus dactyliophorus TaxID=161453 RepID=UPI002406EAED|nr:neuronal pentraxin-1-like isoform X2 [Dunckerocampus dactyliophorus]
MDGLPWKVFLLFWLAESSAQDLGQTQFICTSVPKDVDLCAATMQNSGPAEDLKTTVMQLRETVLQQKETIMNQKETIRELTSKLSRCESQSFPAAGAPGGRRPGAKNTMGDLSRGTAETLAQLGHTLQTLKQRLENLEHYSRGNNTVQANSLKDLLQNKIDDMEKQVLSRVNTLEEAKGGSRNDSEQRNRVESTLTSLHHRITDLEKGKDRPSDRFQLTFPLRTNYMYAKAKRSLPEMYSFTVCLWIKSNASPGVGTPFSYAVPGQANELVLIEWGNNPMEFLINDKDILGGGFDATQAFVGELANLNIWNRKLSITEIYNLATCNSKAPTGNVFSWMESNIEIFGGATKWSFEPCRSVN